MRQTLLPFLLVSLFATSQLISQTEIGSNSLIWRANFENFQFPFSDKIDIDDYTTGMEMTYVRTFNRRLNLAIPLKISKVRLPVDDQGNINESEAIGSLDALLHLKFAKPKSWFQPYLLGGTGVMAETDNEWKFNAEFPVGLGLNFRLAPAVYLSGETQYRFNLSDNRNHISHAVGLWFVLDGVDEPEKITDTDMDGLQDKDDQCPNEAGTAAMFGCPDSDADGVANHLDQCPNEAGPAAYSGCPDSDGDTVPNHLDECPTIPGDPANNGCPNQDRDGDGVPNDGDRCPDTPGSAFTKGCPDLDSDGVADLDDLCPSEAGLPENKGCPDTDGDSVIDPLDKCPNTPGPASNNGCPELKPEEKEVLEFAMQAVQFETGSAKLKAESNTVLDQILDILKKYPEQKIRISGHTDSIGSAEANQSLSEKRAKACYDYFAAKGISAARMSYKGFGESNPIADNRFAPGREKNRRVEFEIYVD